MECLLIGTGVEREEIHAICYFQAKLNVLINVTIVNDDLILINRLAKHICEFHSYFAINRGT